MGGRGSSGTAKSEKAYIRQENRAQANDAKEMGKRAGAKYFEYTDKNGFKYSGETGNTTAKGGVYKAEYDEGVAELNRLSTGELEKLRDKTQKDTTNTYWSFTRQAGSRVSSAVESMAEQGTLSRKIKQVLLRRKLGGK